MRITIEIDDRLLPSIEQYLMTQMRVEPDPDTKAQKHVRVYADVEALVEETIGQVVHHCVQQYPPEHLREGIAAAVRAAEQLKASARPKRVKG